VEHKTLRELIAEWPESAPDTLTGLVAAGYDELKQLDVTDAQRELILGMRTQAIDAGHALERSPINCADDLVRQLSSRRIRPMARAWLIIGLDANNERIAVPRRGGGGLYWLQDAYRDLPDVDQLRSRLRLPRGGRYLIVYGGGPDVLDDPTVVERLETLAGDVPVIDVTFWHLRSGSAPALFSLRGGCGDRGGEREEFPNQPAATRLGAALNTHPDTRPPVGDRSRGE
jgi:hypothetical protein